jgi:4-amino-4-deoxy-L-arabinose transferase-like glycosyltransferase
MEAPAAAPTLPRAVPGWLPWLWSHVLFPGRDQPAGPVRWASLLLVVGLPALLLYPCRGFHLLEPDEGRYAQIPREMLARGEWVVPTLEGEPYLDKPPLLYWLVMVSYRLFGVSAESARLVPALAVHAGVVLTYLFGRRALGERSAAAGAVLLTLAPGYLSVGRLLVLDGLLTLWVTLAVLAGFEAVRGERFRRGWWLLASVACGLGVLTKGPVAGVLLVGPLVLYQLLQRRPVLAHWRAGLVLAAVVLAVNLPWYVAICVRQPEFVRYFLWEHNVVRFLSPFDHLQPVWYYAPILLGGLLPGTLLLVGFARFLLSGDGESTGRRTPAFGFLLLAGGWCVLFFSLSGSKLPTYVLPAFPPLALALGHYAAGRPAPRLWRGALSGGFALVAFAHYVGVPWYAEQRSPVGRPGLVERYCADPETAVVCYPRTCDSVAFYTGRDDLRNVRSKQVNSLVQDLLARPRTVVLFTHRHSLEALKFALPPELRVRDVTSLRQQGAGARWLDLLSGDTPWGLCDVAVIERNGG